MRRMEQLQSQETWVIRFKRRWIPQGSIREAIWDWLVSIYRFLLQIYRLYLRDGWRGVWRYLLMRIRGGPSIAPAWWYSPVKDKVAFDEWNTYLDNLRGQSYKGVIAFYAGVPYIDTQPLRTVWLARTFIHLGYRILFIYWRWRPTDVNPKVDGLPELHQMPMDVFWASAGEILGDERLQTNEKIFFAEFPHPSLFKVMNIANGYNWVTIAEQKDDWEEFHKVGQASWYNPEFESYLFHNADILVATAQNLADKMKQKIDKPVYLIPNAYDPESLNLAQDAVLLDKGDLTIGYFGHLTPAWFDWEMLTSLAGMHPTWIIYLIGKGVPPDNLPENIRLLGVKPHGELAGYAKNWDTAIIPFKSIELSKGVDPLKVYEYLAMGLPVVASGIPHLASIPGVLVANTLGEFEEALKQSVVVAGNFEAVEAYLEEQTWAKRVEKILLLASDDRNRKARNGSS